VYMLTGRTNNETSLTRMAGFLPFGKCAFLDEEDLCILHDKGLKPEQGRESCCETDDAKDNLHYAKVWDTEKGKQVLEKFRKML
jgi:hypothetical protein